ncbi:SLAM family member 9-like isoform X2 [Eleutherodactylus coqui]|uniref:SLAM family member 9-like isoform X2 n=1 Tax=Eleutherodactylus coqui TaxID=57060 RepID=UPI003462074E
MMSSYCAVILLLILQKLLCSDTCSPEVPVHAAEGENVTLQINETEVKEISWLLGGHHIVTTKPGKPVIIKDRKLKQRLQGTDQGSLEIIDVYLEDQGEYSATVFKENNNDCVQHFRVNVYPKLLNEDIEIKSTVSGKEPCNVTLTCAVNRSDVTIFWSSQSESNTVIRDHTLTLYNVHPNNTYSCTAENPAIKTSRSIKPWIFCLEDTATYSFNLAGSHPIWTPVLVIMMFIVGPVLYS